MKPSSGVMGFSLWQSENITSQRKGMKPLLGEPLASYRPTRGPMPKAETNLRLS